jgi:hypothetical protein
MPDYSRTTVFILTPLIFHYHLPLMTFKITLTGQSHSVKSIYAVIQYSTIQYSTVDRDQLRKITLSDYINSVL